MHDELKEAVLKEIERSYRSGMTLILGDAARRVMIRTGGSGPAMTSLIERHLVREASRKCIPVMLGRTGRVTPPGGNAPLPPAEELAI